MCASGVVPDPTSVFLDKEGQHLWYFLHLTVTITLCLLLYPLLQRDPSSLQSLASMSRGRHHITCPLLSLKIFASDAEHMPLLLPKVWFQLNGKWMSDSSTFTPVYLSLSFLLSCGLIILRPRLSALLVLLDNNGVSLGLGLCFHSHLNAICCCCFKTVQPRLAPNSLSGREWLLASLPSIFPTSWGLESHVWHQLIL